MFKKIIVAMLTVALASTMCTGVAFAADGQSLQAAGTTAQLSSTAPKTLTTQASSNTKYQSSTYGGSFSVKAGGATFKAVSMGSSSSYGKYDYKLTMKKGGKTKTLVTNVDCRFTTNGRYVFYAKRGKAVTKRYGTSSSYYHTYKAGIYRLDTKTGKKVKLGSGTDWVVYSGNGSYCYCGRTYSPALGSSAYAVNIKTKKRKAVESYTGAIKQCGGKRILLATITMSLGGGKLYTYKLNGTGKKAIAESVCYYKVKGSTITYMKMEYNGGNDRYRVYQCSVTGKNLKVLSDWKYGYKAVEPLRKAYGLDFSR